MADIYSRLNHCILVWGTLISQAETNKIKVLQNACTGIPTNGRLRQPILSMYKVIKSIRFVEMAKLSLVFIMYKYKKVYCQFLKKNFPTTSKQTKHMKYSYSHPEKTSHSYTIVVS